MKDLGHFESLTCILQSESAVIEVSAASKSSAH